MSGTAVADQTGWQSHRVRMLPRSAALYGVLVAATALAGTLGATPSNLPTGEQWTLFALLLPFAALAPLFQVSVGRNHGFHTGLAFVVAGTLVLPPVLLLGLVLALQPAQWFRDRSAWYIRAFNLSNYSLSALVAWTAASAVGGEAGGGFALAGLAAAVSFVAVNHLLLAIMLRLGRGHSFRQSGLFSLTGLSGDLGLAGLGVALGAFAHLNPWLLPALVAPLVLAHRSFSTLALLRESEERFRTMFESAPTGSLLLSLDGRILAANRFANTLLGYDDAELLGTATSALRHPDDAEAVDEMFSSLTRGERDTFRLEARYVRKDGATVVTHLGAALIRDADGRPDYVIAMAEDVTEQRQLEERLRQSQKLEAVGRLAGGVAHDFNNMLTAIGGYTDFALEHAAPGSPLRSDLDEIRKATERATLLTRQLLAFSRKQVLKPELLNLNGIVLELQSMLRPLIGEDVVLTTELDPALGPIEADPGQLHQVVMNLVVNARDAMPEGGRVSIETANADVGEGDDDAIEPGRYVTLTVRDDGEGMDEATLAQIFEPFFTTKESAKGTGLGLATVYGIVKQSGGYVAVESELGAGSTFTIYLRRADEARVPTPEPAPAVPRSTEPEEAAGRAVVLVAEDVEVVRGLVHQVLAGDGHEVLLAAGGEEAAELARSRRIDVLVTDLAMPGLGGRELAERLRAADPQLRVVFMSGYAEGAYAPEALPPRTAFLQKPFTSGELTGIVRELLAVN
ncbi:MAG TPA: PAS domain S-box protein [Gaiellaceae bacterium]|nr:PAS domain S-box protein [Gaiellaceae bacterium]